MQWITIPEVRIYKANITCALSARMVNCQRCEQGLNDSSWRDMPTGKSVCGSFVEVNRLHLAGSLG